MRAPSTHQPPPAGGPQCAAGRRARRVAGRAGSGRRGSLLVLVLGFIALVAGILVVFLEEAVAKIKYFGLFYHRDDIRLEAYSALETALAVVGEIHEIDGTLWSPVQGWGNPLAYAQYVPPEGLQVSVTFQDESGRIPLTASLDPAFLWLLFEEIGVPLDRSQKLTDHLLDWMDEDNDRHLNGFDGEDYEDLDPPLLPANARLESWAELRLIPGFLEEFYDEETGQPNDKFRQFASCFSFYHSGPVNANTANGTILKVMGRYLGFDPVEITNLLAGLDGEPGTADDRVYKGSGAPSGNAAGRDAGEVGQGAVLALGYTVETLRVDVTVTRGDANFYIGALIRYKGANPSANADQAEDQAQEQSQASDTGRREVRTAIESDPATALGYPFTLIRLVENQKM